METARQSLSAAITGIGIVTPLGDDACALNKLLMNIRTLQDNSDKQQETTQPVFERPTRDFHKITGVKNKRTKKMDDLCKMASIAAHYAITDSGIQYPLPDGQGAVISGSMYGASHSITEFAETLFSKGPSEVNPNIFPSTSHNVAGGHISIHFGLSGPLINFASGRQSTELALIQSLDLLSSGEVELIVCAGWELPPKHVSPPTVPSSAAIVLEPPEKAEKRGADIAAYLGMSNQHAFTNEARPHRPSTGKLSAGTKTKKTTKANTQTQAESDKDDFQSTTSSQKNGNNSAIHLETPSFLRKYTGGLSTLLNLISLVKEHQQSLDNRHNQRIPAVFLQHTEIR
jgi:3-oxoacyl-(acyl-carrier-protein) synthase